MCVRRFADYWDEKMSKIQPLSLDCHSYWSGLWQEMEFGSDDVNDDIFMKGLFIGMWLGIKRRKVSSYPRNNCRRS